MPKMRRVLLAVAVYLSLALSGAVVVLAQRSAAMQRSAPESTSATMPITAPAALAASTATSTAKPAQKPVSVPVEHGWSQWPPRDRDAYLPSSKSGLSLSVPDDDAYLSTSKSGRPLHVPRQQTPPATAPQH